LQKIGTQLKEFHRWYRGMNVLCIQRMFRVLQQILMKLVKNTTLLLDRYYHV